MSLDMTRFRARLAETNFTPLNGKRDPFDLLSSVSSNVGDAQTMMEKAGIFGWNPELIPLSGMDSLGNIYEAPANARGIVVPQFPGGPAYFGQASDGFPFIRPEAVVPLVDAIVAHGNPLTSIIPGPMTYFTFDTKVVDLVPYTDQARALVGEIIQFRFTVTLGNTGKNSLRVNQHGMRLWCANGCTTAETLGAISINHSNLAPAKIQATVDRILNVGNLGLEKWIADARRTIDAKLTRERAIQLWRKLFKLEGDHEEWSTQAKNREAKLIELWSADTQQVTFPGTAWAFFNATTEYLDHHATVRFGNGTKEQALARRVVEGDSATEAIKTRAWEMALAV